MRQQASFCVVIVLIMLSAIRCAPKKDDQQIKSSIAAIDITRGDITLCGSAADQFGTVSFVESCHPDTQADFNLAIALLHSFEYTEAEKVFARVLDRDPACIMAYWGVAMCNFHPLWTPPTTEEYIKGEKIVVLARTLSSDTASRAAHYLAAVATIFDNWKETPYRTRVTAFAKASEKIFELYKDDQEARIFYALALTAAADPKDKTFINQKKAGQLLMPMFIAKPNHPGVAHYIIHTYDFPELAELALPAARKYASIAAASAHAQHMPSHIFTRLGLWDEAIKSNQSSVAAAQCYAANTGMTAHWDEELHGLDYLMYAWLQLGQYDSARAELNYLKSIKAVSPVTHKVVYGYSAMPARFAVETKDWKAAAELTAYPKTFPWDKFPWEASNILFTRVLGNVHLRKLPAARQALDSLRKNYQALTEKGQNYEAELVNIQIKSASAWIALGEGKNSEAITLMREAANLEDGTTKHPVTPGEIVPARELLADMYLELGDYKNASIEYQTDLKTHVNRRNGILGAKAAERKNNYSVR